MFCSCRISTDKRVARSLCHSRATCLLACDKLLFINCWKYSRVLQTTTSPLLAYLAAKTSLTFVSVIIEVVQLMKNAYYQRPPLKLLFISDDRLLFIFIFNIQQHSWDRHTERTIHSWKEYRHRPTADTKSLQCGISAHVLSSRSEWDYCVRFMQIVTGSFHELRSCNSLHWQACRLLSGHYLRFCKRYVNLLVWTRL